MESYGVLFSSRTGNTRALAEAIRAALPQEACVYFGESGAAVPDKRTTLIEMRAEGDIDKEMFRSKKQEIEDRVAKLTEEIKGLQPEKEQASNKEVYLQLFDPQESLPVGGLEGERVDMKWLALCTDGSTGCHPRTAPIKS
ncbi:MAG: hypothetical protein HP031_08540 [Oscillospiraceae bacterium]|nr:hypothetical protein [Oscillospiraceae bacterium]